MIDKPLTWEFKNLFPWFSVSCPTHLLILTQNSSSKSYDSPLLAAPVSSEAKRTIVKKKTLEKSEWIKLDIRDWVGRCLGKPTISFQTHIRHCYHLIIFGCVCVSLSHVLLFATPWTMACQAPQSMGFSRQAYCSGLPFPSPGDLPDPGTESRSPHRKQCPYCLSHHYLYHC